VYDVVVVGAGVAGLSAALTLGRARRRVLVSDGGGPRNAPAARAHGFVSRDGVPPLELLALARAELDAYPGVEVTAGAVTRAAATPRGFGLAVEGGQTTGQTIEARKLVLATGVADVLPEIPGLAELWGRGVYHCPYCHGWEVRGRPWAVLGDAPLAFERVALFRGWTSEVVVLAGGPSGLAEAEKERLVALGASFDERRIASVERTGEDGVEVTFQDGPSLAVGGVFVVPRQVQRSPLAEALCCALDELGPTASRYVRADPVTGETTVPGVYAAGDMTGPMQSLVLAAASGARTAAGLNRALAMEDAEALLATAGSAVT
jgi:thioredoxin reductase